MSVYLPESSFSPHADVARNRKPLALLFWLDLDGGALIYVTKSTAGGASGCCVRSRPIAAGVNLQEPRERKYDGRYRDDTAWDAQIANHLARPDRQERGSDQDRLRWTRRTQSESEQRGEGSYMRQPHVMMDAENSGRLRPRHRARAAAALFNCAGSSDARNHRGNEFISRASQCRPRHLQPHSHAPQNSSSRAD
jgi:hypothetical protein